MGSRMCCCFGWNITEDQQFNEKEIINRDIIQAKTIAKADTTNGGGSDVNGKKTSSQNQLNATKHVTQKVIRKFTFRKYLVF